MILFLIKALQLKFCWRATCVLHFPAHKGLIQAQDLRGLLRSEPEITLENLVGWLSHFTNWKLRPQWVCFFSLQSSLSCVCVHVCTCMYVYVYFLSEGLETWSLHSFNIIQTLNMGLLSFQGPNSPSSIKAGVQ